MSPTDKKVEMSFRSQEALKRASSSGLTLSDLQEGQKVDGRVKRIEDYGLFIQIEGSKLSGLCHKSQVRHSISHGKPFSYFILSSLIILMLTSQLHSVDSVKEIVSKHSSWVLRTKRSR